MLGKRSLQRGMFEADHLYLDFVGEETFYGFPWPVRPPVPAPYNPGTGQVQAGQAGHYPAVAGTWPGVGCRSQASS